jgi:succinate dehydrogenase hydrophobic anchor subunit
MPLEVACHGSFSLVYLTAVLAVVMMWRGLWGLRDDYVWSKKPRLRYWATFIVGFAIITPFLVLVPL